MISKELKQKKSKSPLVVKIIYANTHRYLTQYFSLWRTEKISIFFYTNACFDYFFKSLLYYIIFLSILGKQMFTQII